jgi:hypothetical protein
MRVTVTTLLNSQPKWAMSGMFQPSCLTIITDVERALCYVGLNNKGKRFGKYDFDLYFAK